MCFALEIVGNGCVFLADVQKLHQAFNWLVNISLKSVNVSNFLIALSFFENVTWLFRYVNALVIKLKTHFVLAFRLVFLSNLLVNSDEVSENLVFNFLESTFGSFIISRFKPCHSFILVRNFFFAETKTLVSLGLTLGIFEIKGNIQTTLVEIRSDTVISLRFVTFSYVLVSFKASLILALTPVNFSFD